MKWWQRSFTVSSLLFDFENDFHSVPFPKHISKTFWSYCLIWKINSYSVLTFCHTCTHSVSVHRYAVFLRNKYCYGVNLIAHLISLAFYLSRSLYNVLGGSAMYWALGSKVLIFILNRLYITTWECTIWYHTFFFNHSQFAFLSVFYEFSTGLLQENHSTQTGVRQVRTQLQDPEEEQKQMSILPFPQVPCSGHVPQR